MPHLSPGNVLMSSLTIGESLVARREQLGLDKGRAADQIGMSRTTYGAYEANRQRPSVSVFPALAEFLDVDMEYFLELYGATMILAARPALQRVLATPGDGADEGAVPSDEPTESGGARESGEISGSETPSTPPGAPKRKKDAKQKKKQKKKH